MVGSACVAAGANLQKHEPRPPGLSDGRNLVGLVLQLLPEVHVQRHLVSIWRCQLYERVSTRSAHYLAGSRSEATSVPFWIELPRVEGNLKTPDWPGSVDAGGVAVFG